MKLLALIHMANTFSQNNEYPLYRRLTGADVWYKIISQKEFVELKRVGSRYMKSEVHAKQFPEIQLIQDIKNCYENRWIEILPEEFEFVLTKL